MPAPGITTGKDTLFERLDHLTQNLPRQELLLIEGGASGADALGSEWAEDRSIARASFPAFWKDLDSPRAIVKTGRYGAYNARAGMDRNARMAACTTLLAAFPSRPDISSGTKDMIAQATALGLAYRVVMPTTNESFATDNTYGEHFEIQKHCPYPAVDCVRHCQRGHAGRKGHPCHRWRHDRGAE
ncbi:SLOG family protein [Thiolapillus sp.]|uniref:SLOG family protein n=1 Tax=Thiolapillus sp. TaxID=2017437 RepID=UPI003AF51C68